MTVPAMGAWITYLPSRDMLITTPSWSGQLLVRSIFHLVVLGVLIGCSNHPPFMQPTRQPKSITTARLAGQPLERMLLKLHPENQKYLLDFAATVPEPLPTRAYVSSIFPDPTSPVNGPRIVHRVNGNAEFEIAIANVGTNTNQPNVLCLRNSQQAACSSEAEVWQIDLPPKSIAFVPLQIQAESGDDLTLLFLADREPERYKPSSQIKAIYADHVPELKLPQVTAASHDPVPGLDGCDYVALIKDPKLSDYAENLNFQERVQRDQKLYLLLRLCNPTGREYVHLVPFVDRTRVIDLPGDFWQQHIRLTGATTVIPIDLAKIGPAEEFQVVINPLNQEAQASFRHYNYTQAIRLAP